MTNSELSSSDLALSDRYRRQLSLPSFGLSAQKALAEAHVLCIGAGGLGSPALQYLAAAGIGRITIVDDDVVELSNLHRQIIHTTDDIGKNKVDSASAHIAAINPDTVVETHARRLDWEFAVELCARADVVFDGSDNFATRHIVSAACAQAEIPHVWGSILGFDAQMSVFWAGRGPIYEDLYPHPPAAGQVPNCAQAGVLGPIVGIVGTTMALEVIKIISGVGAPMIGKAGHFDGLHSNWRYFPLAANPEVTTKVQRTGPVTHEIPSVRDAAEALATGLPLIDVREPEEFAEGHLEGARNIPLSTIRADEEYKLPSPALVYCASGMRSAVAIELMTQRGVTGILNVRGGIL